MKKPMFVAVMLAMVLVVAVPALAQMEESAVAPAEEPVAACAWGPTEVSSPENPYAPNARDPFDHGPGEFLVSYHSEEAMWASPQENVIGTSDIYHDHPSYTPLYMQKLRFKDTANIPDPCERLAAEEAKRQEILSWPGVKHAGYNGYMYVQPAAGPG